MVGWRYQLDGHEFEQTPGESEGQGSLVCCSPWGLKESDTTERLSNSNKQITHTVPVYIIISWYKPEVQTAADVGF